MKYSFFCALPCIFISVAGLLFFGAKAGGARVHHGEKRESRSGYAARALGVQSRASWQVNHEVASRRARAKQDNAKPTKQRK